MPKSLIAFLYLIIILSFPIKGHTETFETVYYPDSTFTHALGVNDKSKVVGNLIAKKATEKKIASVVFDRGGYRYHGRVQAVAEGAREGGLKF